jgi:ABC-type amino acid transport substrate-binding protein
MDAVQSTGRLTAGVSYDIPGMGFRNPASGAIEGFEPDLARAIAAELFGATDRVDFLEVTDAGRIAMLEEGRVDVVISQLTITPDRAAEVDFSIPYLVTGEGLLVDRGVSIAGVDDLCGKRIAVTAGSVSLRRMTACLESSLKGARLVVTKFGYDGLEALEKNEVDAVSNDLVNLRMLQRASGRPDEYGIVDISARFPEKPFGVAVRKGRQPLLDRLNIAIEAIRARGEIDRLLQANLASVTGPADGIAA